MPLRCVQSLLLHYLYTDLFVIMSTYPSDRVTAVTYRQAPWHWTTSRERMFSTDVTKALTLDLKVVETA
jgi:hypothetical protein